LTTVFQWLLFWGCIEKRFRQVFQTEHAGNLGCPIWHSFDCQLQHRIEDILGRDEDFFSISLTNGTFHYRKIIARKMEACGEAGLREGNNEGIKLPS